MNGLFHRLNSKKKKVLKNILWLFSPCPIFKLYLFERVTVKMERGRMRDLSGFFTGSLFQIPTTSMARSGQNHEPESPFSSLMIMEETQLLEPSSDA